DKATNSLCSFPSETKSKLFPCNCPILRVTLYMSVVSHTWRSVGTFDITYLEKLPKLSLFLKATEEPKNDKLRVAFKSSLSIQPIHPPCLVTVLGKDDGALNENLSALIL